MLGHVIVIVSLISHLYIFHLYVDLILYITNGICLLFTFYCDYSIRVEDYFRSRASSNQRRELTMAV